MEKHKIQVHIYNKIGLIMGIVEIILAFIILSFPEHFGDIYHTGIGTYTQAIPSAIYRSTLIFTRSIISTIAIIFGYGGFKKIFMAFVKPDDANRERK